MAVRSLTVSHNGVDYIGEICTIKSTFLGVEDHGIMVATLELSGDGWGQYVQSPVLDGKPISRDGERVSTAFGMEVIKKIMWAVGVRSWEELSFNKIVALCTVKFGTVVGIAHITEEDRVVIFGDILREMEKESK